MYPAPFPASLTTEPLVRGAGAGAVYAITLLKTLGFDARRGPGPFDHPAECWARSGAMALTGFSGGPPLMCPAPLASCASGVKLALEALLPEAFVDLDGAAMLGARAAFTGYRRNGAIAPGGGCRLLPTRDGIIAINLVREDDWIMLPAWLEEDVAADWDALGQHLATRRLEHLVERARLLGLAVAAVTPPSSRPWFRVGEEVRVPPPKAPPRVVDLSSLWAGPLAARLLRRAGAHVVKVESETRPDGARLGNRAFFDFVNAGKEEVRLDFRTQCDELVRLIESADIVIEASRPRALLQLGIDANALVRKRPGLLWLSITGHGRDAPEGEWIAFGDDAGIAAGLGHIMKEAHGQPLFCADAVADPLTGLHAALAALAFYRQGRGGLVALSLSDVVAHCAMFDPPREGWRVRAKAWGARLAERGIVASPPRVPSC